MDSQPPRHGFAVGMSLPDVPDGDLTDWVWLVLPLGTDQWATLVKDEDAEVVTHNSFADALERLGAGVDSTIADVGADVTVTTPIPLPPEITLQAPEADTDEASEVFWRIETHLGLPALRRVTYMAVIARHLLLTLAPLPGYPGRVTVTVFVGPIESADQQYTLTCPHDLPILDARFMPRGTLRVQNLPHLDACRRLPATLAMSVPLPEGASGDIESWEIGAIDAISWPRDVRVAIPGA